MALGSILKQPLLWFSLIGALLFFADSRLKEERSEIIVTPTLRDRLANL